MAEMTIRELTDALMQLYNQQDYAGALELLEIQAAGGKRMSARDYLRGNPMTFDRSKE